MAARRIVEAQAGTGRRPVGEHAHEIAARQVVAHRLVGHPRQRDARQRGRARARHVVERQRPRDVDRHRLALLQELPATQRAAGHPRAHAGVGGQVGRGPWHGMTRKVVGRAHHRHAQVRAHRHRDHVARHVLGQPDAGVVAGGDDVDQAAFGDDVHVHPGMAPHVLVHQRGRHQRRAAAGVDAQRAVRRRGEVVGGLHGIADLRQRRRDLGDEALAGLGQRDAARGAVEQPHAQARLEPGDRVAQRRRGHAQFDRARAETAAPGDGQDGFEFDQSALVHCPDYRNESFLFV